jgi:hypothetical protein
MTLNLIRPQQFTTVLGALTDPSTVYVVPSFQRPYAWVEKQTRDLLRDMEKATLVKGSHYLSALHLIGIDLREEATLTEFLDERGNDDLENLKRLTNEDGLRTAADAPVHVYAVVDGQQRLTTLFLLAHIYYRSELKRNPHLQSGLDLHLRDGTTIPRLIQNPAADHTFMRELIDWIRVPELSPPEAKRQSQRRMLANTKTMLEWATVHLDPLRFLRSEKFKTSVIELEAEYGLTSFLTLNDRGRPLTVLEKLKSLLLQFASDAPAPDLVHRLHATFGKLYRVLDDCQHVKMMDEDNGDDEMVRLLSCYLRIESDSSAIQQGANAAYQDFFREHLMHHTDEVRSIVGKWCSDIDEMSDQLAQLNSYLDGTRGRDVSSLHFEKPTSLSDDYRVIVLSLRLQPHLIALLLKFRAIFKVEWHERFPINAPAPDAGPINELLRDVRQRAQATGAPTALFDYLDSLLSVGRERRQHLSMLEVVERLQLLDWNLGSRKISTFSYRCNETFGHKVAGNFVSSWAAWRSSDDFVHHLLHEYNDTNIRYILKEYERGFGSNLHFDIPARVASDAIALEHVLAQGIEGDPSFTQVGGFCGLGVADRSEYDNKLLWRSGNFTWLSQTANTSIGNQLPNVKAAHYRQCQGHPSGSGRNICSEVAITKKIGNDLGALNTEYRCFRLYVEARCAELALFAVRRFC